MQAREELTLKLKEVQRELDHSQANATAALAEALTKVAESKIAAAVWEERFNTLKHENDRLISPGRLGSVPDDGVDWRARYLTLQKEHDELLATKSAEIDSLHNEISWLKAQVHQNPKDERSGFMGTLQEQVCFTASPNISHTDTAASQSEPSQLGFLSMPLGDMHSSPPSHEGTATAQIDPGLDAEAKTPLPTSSTSVNTSILQEPTPPSNIIHSPRSTRPRPGAILIFPSKINRPIKMPTSPINDRERGKIAYPPGLATSSA